jgi:hypothetical protein
MTAKTKLTRADLDKAILLREAVTDYILADALDGIYRTAEWTQMHAAFSVADNGALTELCADLKRDLNFIEPAAVLKTLSREQREKLDTASYTKLLRETPGTRLFARDDLEDKLEETPFG